MDFDKPPALGGEGHDGLDSAARDEVVHVAGGRAGEGDPWGHAAVTELLGGAKLDDGSGSAIDCEPWATQSHATEVVPSPNALWRHIFGVEIVEKEPRGDFVLLVSVGGGHCPGRDGLHR